MERFDAPSTRTLRRISVHWSMSVCTLLPFCSSAQARSLEAGANRTRDGQVLPFSINAFRCSGAAVFDHHLHETSNRGYAMLSTVLGLIGADELEATSRYRTAAETR